MNTINGLSPGGTAGRSAGCSAGEAAGWMLRGVGRCCVEYSFRALTAQEAYETYGIAPYASDISAAAATWGVRLKDM